MSHFSGVTRRKKACLGLEAWFQPLLAAVVADSETRTEHNSNQELIGQGIGSL
jgi:SulP family sulfate permease